jgi:hypothetical protein
VVRCLGLGERYLFGVWLANPRGVGVPIHAYQARTAAWNRHAVQTPSRWSDVESLDQRVRLAACRGGPQGDVAVTDSAGVRVTVSADAYRTFATVNPEPLLSLGGADAAGPSEFFRIAGVHMDPHGNLWVADGGSAELRLFRPDGTHWKTRGGRGDGPGEFRRGGRAGLGLCTWCGSAALVPVASSTPPASIVSLK